MRRSSLTAVLPAALLLTGCGWSPPSAEASADGVEAVADSTVVVRRLLAADAPPPYGAFPDGRRLVVVDTVGDLGVRDIETGRHVALTSDGSWMEGRYPMDAAVSPDGSRVAFSWVSDSTMSVRVVDADGGGLETLARGDARDRWLSVAGWTPDGAAVLVLESTDAGDRLAAIDARSGAHSELHDFGWTAPRTPKLSPDGSLVALTRLAAEGSTSRDLYLLDRTRGSLRPLVDLDEGVRLVDWSADGGAVYFLTERDGIATLWRQRVAGGSAAGDPERIRGDLTRFHPLGRAGGGLLFLTSDRDLQLRHVQLAAGSDAVAAPPVALVDEADGFIASVTWSPDAQHLAYTLRGLGGDQRIVVRSRASGETRTFEAPPRLSNGMEWREDGLFLMARAGGDRLYRLDFDAGALRQAEDLAPLRAFQLPRTSADGSARLMIRSGDTPTSPRRLVVTDLRSGSERVLVERPVIGTARLSPDGRHVALIEPGGQNRLALLTTATGETRTLYTSAGRSWIKGGSMAWTPDGRGVLLLEMDIRDGQPSSRFKKVTLDGRVTEVLNAGGPGGAVGFGLSPDGRHLAYTSSERDVPRTEVWLVEGLEGF